MLALLLFLIGVVALLGGAEMLVRGASRLALRVGISPAVIGLTVVAYGTSLPEVMVSTAAAANGTPAIALGNVFGSNICNLGLVLGVALLLRPTRLHDEMLRRELPWLLLVSVLVVVLLADGRLQRWEGTALLALALLFTVDLVRRTRSGRYRVADEDGTLAGVHTGSWFGELLLLLVGIAAVVSGGEWVVAGAVELARILGISERAIGLSMVALGTSLPEVVTSLVAYRRAESELGIGNLVGSNLFNISVVLGAAGAVAPFSFAFDNYTLDVALALLLPIVLFPIFGPRGGRVGRVRGALLLGVYLVYTTLVLAGRL